MNSNKSLDYQLRTDYTNLYKITKKNNLLERLFTSDPEEFVNNIDIKELIKSNKYVIKKVIAYVQNSEGKDRDKFLKPINENISTLLENKFTRDIGLE